MAKRSPFRYFKTNPEIIRLAVMMYIRFPLLLRNVEDLLHERGSTLAMKRYGSGGTAWGRCLRWKSENGASMVCDRATGGGISTRSL
jgi:hypothetical protein